MKQLFFLFLFISSIGYGQDFSKIDNLVKTYPRYTSPENLANRISRDFKSDANKARAAFQWLTNNIRYNLEEYYKPKRIIQFRYSTEEERQQKLQAVKDKLVKDAFLTKMGVCEEYAQSFKKVADLLGIEAEVIKGYVRNSVYDIGRIPTTTNHAWNVVKIDNRWVLLDATWAAGYVYNGKWIKSYSDYYYDINQKEIGKTHFPKDRKWQIILNSNSLKDFYNQPIYSQPFLKNNIEVLSPKEGSISVNRSEKVVLKIRNLPPNSVLHYNYKGQQYSKKPQISYTDNIATVSIENPGQNTELYLFLDKALALEYKVIVH